MPESDGLARPSGDDRAGEANTVAPGCFEPFLGRLGQLRGHRAEQGDAVSRPATGDDLEVMSAMPDNERRSMIPSVEGVAGIARVAFEFLGRRLPVVDRSRRDDGRQVERDRAPGLLRAADIGPLGPVQVVFVGLTNLDRVTPRRAVVARITIAEAAIVGELRQMA